MKGYKVFNPDFTCRSFLFEVGKAYSLLCEVDTKMWIYTEHMSSEEKEKYPSHKTSGGYLKDIPFKEAFQNKWHNWSDASKKVFTSLPNFDAAIFEKITGVTTK